MDRLAYYGCRFLAGVAFALALLLLSVVDARRGHGATCRGLGSLCTIYQQRSARRPVRKLRRKKHVKQRRSVRAVAPFQKLPAPASASMPLRPRTRYYELLYNPVPLSENFFEDFIPPKHSWYLTMHRGTIQEMSYVF